MSPTTVLLTLQCAITGFRLPVVKLSLGIPFLVALAASVACGQPPSRGHLTLTDPRQLCAKYLLDYPIKTNEKSSWVEQSIVEGMLRDLFKSREAWISQVGFNGKEVVVYGVKQARFGDRKTNDQIRSETTEHVNNTIAGLFANPVSVVCKVSIDRTGGVGDMVALSKKDLKPSLLNNSRINYDAVWVASVNSLRRVPEVEADGSTQKRSGTDGFIRTMIKPVESDGYVTRYWSEITMRKPQYDKDKDGGFYVQLEVVLVVERRRAGAGAFTRIQVGGDIHGSKLNGVFDSPSSNQILNAITAGLQK